MFHAVERAYVRYPLSIPFEVRYPLVLEARALEICRWSVMRYSRSSRLSYRRIINATHLTYRNSQYTTTQPC